MSKQQTKRKSTSFSLYSEVIGDGISELSVNSEKNEENQTEKNKFLSPDESFNSVNNSNLLSPPWEKKHSRRSLSEGNWNMKNKENPSKTEKSKLVNEDLSRTPSLPSKWSIKRATLYKTELCRAFEETGKCKFGDECIFAHSEEELRPRVDRHPKYKTRICRTFWEQGECPYGKRCCFIHTERDISHPDDFSVFEAQMMQQQQFGNSLNTDSLLNGNHRRMQSAPEGLFSKRHQSIQDSLLGFSMTPLDRASISEKASIHSFETSSKLKEEILDQNIEEESEDEAENENSQKAPEVLLMDETGSITKIIQKPKKSQRFTSFLKVGSHKNSNNMDETYSKAEHGSVGDGRTKGSKWFNRSKSSQSGKEKNKSNGESSSSSSRNFLSFGRKDKDGQNEKHGKSFFPFGRSSNNHSSSSLNSENEYSHDDNQNNSNHHLNRRNSKESYHSIHSMNTPTSTPPPMPTQDFLTLTPPNGNLTAADALGIPPPLPSPPLEKSDSTLLAADALFGNAPSNPSLDNLADEVAKVNINASATAAAAAPSPVQSISDTSSSESKSSGKKPKNLMVNPAIAQTKAEDVSSPRRSFLPSFLFSAISKN